MKAVYRRCAGLDVHKDSVSACIRRRMKGSKETEVEEEVFSTCTSGLISLRKWLRQRNVKQVAMESTGIYWIPVWNVLEGGSLELTLVNPATVHALQGKKTDRIDAARIAEYLQYGLLSGSFVPPKPVRQLRELTRMRVHVQQDRNRVISRIGRLLETVNVKLGSVVSDITGKTGRSVLRALAEGQNNPQLLADRAVGSLRSKVPALILALEGRPDEHFRWMLTGLLNRLESLDDEVKRIDLELRRRLVENEDLLERLATIPGVDRIVAQAVLAEVGDLSAFPNAAHLASWAGLCPGNAESAGKRFSGRTRKGNRYLRRILTQSAWAASRKKNSFLQAFYFRVAQRRGNRKALIAVAHRILIIIWNIIREGDVYRERGGNFFDRLNPLSTARKLSRRLENIGFTVALAAHNITSVTAAIAVPAEVCGKCNRWKLQKCIHDRPKPKREYKKQPIESTS